ncbi:MAG TPA: VWA domain-containing protein [Pyrinomonadaceae bacterium]
MSGAARSGARRLHIFLVALLLISSAAFSAPMAAPAGRPQRHVRPREVGRPSTQPAPTAGAQAGQGVGDDEVVSVDTLEVLLPVTVRDAQGRLVDALAREDFRVFEDGREQPLRDMVLRQAAADVALMVDASSSSAANLDDFRSAVAQFASKLAPEDRVCLIKFDDRVELLLDWTSSRAQLRRALDRLAGGMFTRFHDALYLAAKEQFRSPQRRHVAVVLTDGIDNGRGATTLEGALRQMLIAQAAVYVISNTEIQRAKKRAELDSILSGPDASVRFSSLRIEDLKESLRVLDASEQSLARLTAATGGRLFVPESFAALEGVYAEVADELSRQYALYYSPLNKTRDGGFRRVRVGMSKPGLQVTARVGYYAPQ